MAPRTTSFDVSVHGNVSVDNIVSPQFEGVTVYFGATGCILCSPWNQAGPFFVFDNGIYLTRDSFVKEIQKVLS